MVRPAAFGYNAQTALSNAFQHQPTEAEAGIGAEALREFDGFVHTLREKGIQVLVIDDTPDPPKPDAVFPNNWISTTADGRIFLYPMLTPNRRTERRPEIVDALKASFIVREVVDLSGHEAEGRFLEGTGSVVMDQRFRVAYACLSARTDAAVLQELCGLLGYAPVTFTATDKKGLPIYHTNVVMCVGTDFAVACLDCIPDDAERKKVRVSLERTGREVISITYRQMEGFAGNMLEVESAEGMPFLILSETAAEALSRSQYAKLSRYAELLPVQIPTIERIGGGSARCMMAEIFLQQK